MLRHVRRSRWFGGKARQIRSGAIVEVVPIPIEKQEAFLTILRIEYTEGEPESYLVPVAFARGDEAAQVANDSPWSIIANVEVKGSPAGTGYLAYDALASAAFRTALLETIGRRRSLRGQHGAVTGLRTRGVYTRTRGAAQERLESVAMRTEQSNSSVVYGDRFILKLYRRLEEGTSPELEVGRYLTERQPFPNVTPVAGAVEYRGAPPSEPVTLAILHKYARAEGDAWAFTLDALGRYFDHALARTGASAPLPATSSPLALSREPAPPEGDVVGPYLESARLLGQRTAELHLALASAVEDEGFAPEPFSAIYQRSLYHGYRAYLVQVLGELRNALPSLPAAVREDAEAVVARGEAILGRFQAITRRRIAAMRIRCHGDYHLGQVLHTGNDFIIIDFEGEPARSLGERRIKHSPLRDVAGMLRSFHYATHVALRGQTSTVVRSEDLPVLGQWARAWYLWVSSAFLRAYVDLMANTPVLPSRPDDIAVMLDAYLLQKALYEVNYELNNRPDWLTVPLQGVLQVLESNP